MSPGPGVDDEFEIPLRRPYAPMILLIAVMTPLGLWVLLHEHRPRPHHLISIANFLEANPLVSNALAIALLGFAAWFCLALACVARHPRWALRATDGGLHLPRSRVPIFASALERVPWRDLLLIHLNAGHDLIVETRTRKWVIPLYWLETRGKAQAAAAALEERLRREQQESAPRPRADYAQSVSTRSSRSATSKGFGR